MSKLFVIMYHFVKNKNDTNVKYFNYLDKDKFYKQIKYLNKNYQIIDPIHKEEYFKKNNKKLCWLTFDDGYIDHYNNVVPILNHFNLKGSFFPVIKTLNSNTILNVNKIQALVNTNNNKKLLDLIEREFNKKYQFKFNFKLIIKNIILKNKKKRRFDKTNTILIKILLQKYLDKDFRNYLINLLFKKFISDNNLNNKNIYMNLKQLKELQSNGHEIGCHFYSHEWLESMTNKELKKEVKLSIKYFKENFNSNLKKMTACYPYGSYDLSVKKYLKKIGIKYALTTNIGYFNSIKMDNLEIPRFDTNDFKKLF